MTDAHDQQQPNDLFLALYPQGEMDHGIFFDCWCEPNIKIHSCMNCGTVHRIYLHRSHIELSPIDNAV